MATAGVMNGSDNNSSPCSFETNWRVAAGSLKRTVIVESSSEDSPLAASLPDSDYDAATSLVLKPKVPDSGPCEIKICFLQEHEIRQIYVRSTARVYEIYYAKSSQSDDEYLCTVRCSIAERDEQVLQAFGIKDSSESTENPSGELEEEKSPAEGNIGTSEDDWVEVKVLDSSFENKINTLSNKNARMGRDIQDFYEATAEISDSDPCTSIILRLLSLQNKSCLCVDEVYIFTEPVSAIDSDCKSQDLKGSSGSSLMALLVPSLLQLSKSGMNQTQGHQPTSDLQNCSKIETQSKTTELSDLTSHQNQNERGSDDQQYVKVQRVDGSATEPAETHPCNQILNGEKSDNLLVKDDSAYGHIEKVLDQLVSRVGRIEEVCLRFEENMLKPLSSMEMRIQQVEQKLEELVNNSQHSGFLPCMRISAPSFSCISNSGSFHNDNDGCDYNPCRALESEKKEVTSSNLFNASDDILSSANVPHHLPTLVVTAPEFSCEDDVDDDGNKSQKISSQESQKKPLIDDILAASLSGFLSSSTGNISEHNRTTEIASDKVPAENVSELTRRGENTSDMNKMAEPSRYTEVLTVMAPEFTSEDNANKEHLKYAEVASVAFPKFMSEIGESGNDVTSKATGDGGSIFTSDFSDISINRLVSDHALIPSTIASAVFADADSKIPNDAPSGVVDEQKHVSERSNRCNFIVRSSDDKGDEAEATIGDAYQIIISSDHIGPVNSLISGKDDEFEDVSAQKTDGNHITVAAGSGPEYVAAEGPDEEILQNLSELSNASLVDFGIPILDVKFTPYEDPTPQLPLETLLADAISHNVEADVPEGNALQDPHAQGILDVKVPPYEDPTPQLPLEALLDDAINHNVEADVPEGNALQDPHAQGINFIDTHEEGETGDSLTGTSLAMDVGIYDMALSSTESVLDESYLTYKQETVASLI